MIERIFSKPLCFLMVLGIITTYLLHEKRVLNFPNYVNVVLLVTAFVIVFILVVRYDKRKRSTIIEHIEELEKEDSHIFSGPVLSLLGITLIACSFLCLIKLPIFYYIEYCARANALKSERVEIDDIKLRNKSTIYVKFRGEVEKLEGMLHHKKKQEKQKFIENYDVQLEYRESILGTSVLEKFRVLKKKEH